MDLHEILERYEALLASLEASHPGAPDEGWELEHAQELQALNVLEAVLREHGMLNNERNGLHSYPVATGVLPALKDFERWDRAKEYPDWRDPKTGRPIRVLVTVTLGEGHTSSIDGSYSMGPAKRSVHVFTGPGEYVEDNMVVDTTDPLHPVREVVLRKRYGVHEPVITLAAAERQATSDWLPSEPSRYRYVDDAEAATCFRIPTYRPLKAGTIIADMWRREVYTVRDDFDGVRDRIVVRTIHDQWSTVNAGSALLASIPTEMPATGTIIQHDGQDALVTGFGKLLLDDGREVDLWEMIS